MHRDTYTDIYVLIVLPLCVTTWFWQRLDSVALFKLYSRWKHHGVTQIMFHLLFDKTLYLINHAVSANAGANELIIFKY